MLNEKISKFSNFGDSDGIYFIFHSIISGVSSISSLKQFVIHHHGHIDVDVDASLMLFNELKIINYDKDRDLINPLIHFANTKEEFVNQLAQEIVNLLIQEEILHLDSITYDIQEDKFYINRKCISIKYACFRNLLINLGVLNSRTSNTFYIQIENINKTNTPINNRRKISQAQLLKQIQFESEQGEKGEQFVLKYEQKRLDGKRDINCIKQISTIDVGAGYDIISFNDINSTKLDRLIEVKTYQGKPHFHWSSNEMAIAKLRMNHYFLYLVSYDRINDKNYEPLIIQNPIEYFKNNIEWQYNTDSILVKKI